MDAMTKKDLQIIATKIRMAIIEGTFNAKSGHPGGSLSAVEMVTALYFHVMNIDPENPEYLAAKEKGLHTCMDTSLYAPPTAIEALLPYVDMWLPDYKAEDDVLHKKFTKASNKAIKKNLERLVAAKANIEVRCLSVPRCTDGEDLAARHRYLNSIGIPEKSIVDLEYNDYARSKYLALGMKDTMPVK